MLPPVNGGLHCGGVIVACDPNQKLVLPPVNGGLHCGPEVQFGCLLDGKGAPAGQRRAPLQHWCRRTSCLRRGKLVTRCITRPMSVPVAEDRLLPGELHYQCRPIAMTTAMTVIMMECVLT
ncbi:MAG: hypothetical protein ACRDRJ_13790 [Streptosporangiaceae bacterium]